MARQLPPYKLKHPVSEDVPIPHDGEGEAQYRKMEFSEVVITSPNGRKVREIMALVDRAQDTAQAYSAGEMMLDCTQILSDMPEGGIDEIDAEDIKALGDLIAPFLTTVLGEEEPKADGTGSDTSTDESPK